MNYNTQRYGSIPCVFFMKVTHAAAFYWFIERRPLSAHRTFASVLGHKELSKPLYKSKKLS